ncbi:DUF3558 family protein [Actinokineospora sp.]|uniref:DUF3558 family protein n=1 Tax=Actinokineospora sp. TaxID=1872133 RepID=UPI0040380C93
MRLALVLAALLAAGCSSSSPTAAGPAASGSSRPSTLDIPAVPAPLDAKAFADDPCTLFGDAQRAELALAVSRVDDSAGRKACDLSADPGNPRPLEFLRVQVMSDRGLAVLYAQCGSSASARCDTWSTATVDGYPLIRANGETEAKYGSCKQFLGISDRSVILLNDVRAGSATAPDCARADRAAAMILAKLK